MTGYKFSRSNSSCRLGFHNEIEKLGSFSEDYKHYKIIEDTFDFMRNRGFEIINDPETEKRFPSISADHFYGRKGDLEFKADRYPSGFSIEFFQNVVFENRNGGRYDAYKFGKMPYLIRLSYLNETNRIMDYWKSKEHEDDSKIKYKKSEDKVKQHLVESWHRPQKDMNFNLSDLDGTMPDQTYNRGDRDKKDICNGEIKYFRDYDGRLMRCKVYHNSNNMWWCILNDTEYTNEASFELFDASEEDFKKRRVVKDARPRFQYAVITSQHGYSYFSFICKFDKNTFMENAKVLAKELIIYRANDGRTVRDNDLGDLTYHKKKTIRSSYNINAQGDIYFRNSNSIEDARATVGMWNKQAKDSRGTFRRKGMAADIRKYHDKDKIENMVKKYFEVVQ